MRYILNSAVITAYGTYQYEACTIQQAKEWISKGNFLSTIRYGETIQGFNKIFGTKLASNAATVNMQANDEALVFRLVFPKGYRSDPKKKGGLGLDFILKNHEIGILRRIA